MHRITRAHLFTALLATIVIEATFYKIIDFGTMRPNLVLVLVIFAGLYSSWSEALEAGIVAGLLRGGLGTDSIGINIAVLSLSGLLASYFSNKIFKDNFATQIFLVFSLALFANGISVLAKTMVDAAPLVGMDLSRATIKSIVTLSFYTSLCSPPFVLILKKTLLRED